MIKFKQEFLDDVFDIEKNSFDNHWSKPMLLECANNDAAIFKVLVEKEKTVGFYIVTTACTEAELLKIAIDKTFRNSGFAKKALLNIEKESIYKKCDKIFLEVSKSNSAALNLYLASGFETINIRKNYYGTQDALIMRKFL
ncbi:MAG: ribosomal protein S18-alanine N-acetyltransferase [Elusimicrobiota bacterium]|nr:ribosomal protein S18-alanine N-acetyltransferase [Elusimicrobiota bacterium]